MPAKNLKRIADEGIYFHIYNKGVEGIVIFKDDDFKVFIGYLEDCLTAPRDPDSLKRTFKVRGRTFKGIPYLPKNFYNQVELIAYNLTPDHFHLLVRQVTKGSVENFIRSVCTRYSMYFNKKHGRKGTLFSGPYKSAPIKNEKQLQLLTRYLHSDRGYSSYTEYLGKQKRPWVKPQVVLSDFEKRDISYKDFVEKSKNYQSRLLESITLDSESEHLKGREPIRAVKINPDAHSGLPQFLMVSISIFVLLTTIGVGNILISSSSVPDILSETKTIIPYSPEATSEAIPELLLEASETSLKLHLKTTITVKIDDNSSYVNIRQKPTTGSEKIGQAINGDTFEFVNLDSGWFEVKLASGSGFISEKYALVEEQTYE